MNSAMIDGITNIDEDLIEKYFDLKTKLMEGKKQERKTHRMWRTVGTIAACICLVVLITLPLMIQEDDIEYTSFQTYEEVAQIIGYDTLLKNIDFSNMENHSIKMFHKDGDTDRYEKLEFIAKTAKYSYELNINFNTDDYIDDYYKGGAIKEIKGVGVEINKIEISPNSTQYVARFEYKDCKYIIKSLDNISEETFYDLLNEILD